MKSLSPKETGSELSNEVIRQTAAEVVARPDYELDQGLDENSRSLLMMLLSWVMKPFIWLFQTMGGLPTAVKVLVIAILVVVLVALIAHIVYSIISAIKGTKRIRNGSLAVRERPLNPVDLEESAKAAAGQGHYVEAIRMLFKAALVRIEQAEKKKFRAGITNREILKRYRKSSLADPLGRIIHLVDRKWYGDEPCGQTDFDICISEHQSICLSILRRQDALRA